MIIYHDDLRFHADEWTPLHALHSSQKGTINLGTFFYARCQLVERAELLTSVSKKLRQTAVVYHYYGLS